MSAAGLASRSCTTTWMLSLLPKNLSRSLSGSTTVVASFGSICALVPEVAYRGRMSRKRGAAMRRCEEPGRWVMLPAVEGREVRGAPPAVAGRQAMRGVAMVRGVVMARGVALPALRAVRSGLGE